MLEQVDIGALDHYKGGLWIDRKKGKIYNRDGYIISSSYDKGSTNLCNEIPLPPVDLKSLSWSRLNKYSK